MPNTQVNIPMNIYLNMDLCIFTLDICRSQFDAVCVAFVNTIYINFVLLVNWFGKEDPTRWIARGD